MNAGEYFNNGYSCSESMIKWAIDEGLVSEDILPLATPFSGGMGAGCICGAIVGAQMIIGSQYGRDNKFENENIARAKAKELIHRFMEKHKATCCRVLTRGMEFSGPNRKAHCTNMVDDCQKIVNDLLNSEKSGILK